MDNSKNFKTERSTRQLQRDGKDGEAKFYLEGCAAAVRAAGENSLGSYAVHIFANDITREITIKIQNQLKIDGGENDATEAIVSKSLDELRKDLMKSFGREDNGRRK